MTEVDACLELLLSSTVNQLNLVVKAKAIMRTNPLWIQVELDDIRRCHVNQVELLDGLEKYIEEKQTKFHNSQRRTKP